MNVLFLVEGAQLGGAEADVLRLAAELLTRGHRAVLGSLGEPPASRPSEGPHDAAAAGRGSACWRECSRSPAPAARTRSAS